MQQVLPPIPPPVTYILMRPGKQPAALLHRDLNQISIHFHTFQGLLRRYDRPPPTIVHLEPAE